MVPTLFALAALFPAANPAVDAQVVPVVLYTQPPEPVAPQPLPPPLPLPPRPDGGADGRPAFWARADALAWWVQGFRLPVLATESPAGARLADAGLVSTRGTRGILGGDTVNGDVRFGGRLEVGTWLGCDCQYGLQVGLFCLGDAGESASVGDLTGRRILGRPYVGARRRTPAAEVVSFPGTRAGAVLASADSTDVMGADALARFLVLCEPCGDGDFRLDFLLGYRYLYLAEGLSVREDVAQLSGSTAGTTAVLLDAFRTTNRFNGGSLGAATFYNCGAISIEAAGRLSMGLLNSDVLIDGSTTTAARGAAPQVTPGGLLTQITNLGRHPQGVFTLVPEADFRLGWAATSWLRLTAGYSFLLLQRAFRPGDQVDLQINSSQLPGAGPASGVARPTLLSERTDVWIQGLSFGAELCW